MTVLLEFDLLQIAKNLIEFISIWCKSQRYVTDVRFSVRSIFTLFVFYTISGVTANSIGFSRRPISSNSFLVGNVF